jgi:hypothetical protein
MARIHFIAVKAEKLAAVIAVVILAVALTGYLALFRSGSRNATPVPKALLLRSLPVSTTAEPAPPPMSVCVLQDKSEPRLSRKSEPLIAT